MDRSMSISNNLTRTSGGESIILIALIFGTQRVVVFELIGRVLGEKLSLDLIYFARHNKQIGDG
jgi:hypothetical protein